MEEAEAAVRERQAWVWSGSFIERNRDASVY